MRGQYYADMQHETGANRRAGRSRALPRWQSYEEADAWDDEDEPPRRYRRGERSETSIRKITVPLLYIGPALLFVAGAVAYATSTVARIEATMVTLSVQIGGFREYMQATGAERLAYIQQIDRRLTGLEASAWKTDSHDAFCAEFEIANQGLKCPRSRPASPRPPG